ncbi:DUF4232 domain-containing protein [Streptomyces xanthii]|uniref:DUF4232 domain-containing protein n=1 Tax=Streptomyces xanthii TaxID=2768069 RepID=A0A7H1B0F4_9ACTN|nr:DUF4232 domain-containing protein [Streptomyces xanthii]QNS02209.1 DUF4232 domain-containing protein [Streptomyces xanthii]
MTRTTARAIARTTVLAATAAILSLSLTACNGDDNASDSTQASPTASADKAGGTGTGKTDGGADTSTGTGGSDQGAGTGTGDNSGGFADVCRTDVLEVTAADNTTDKTEGVVTVSLKNIGAADCRMRGFAGVDLKTSLGDTVSVDRNGEQAVPQTLEEGETAAFNVTFPVNNTGGSGVKLTDMVVTPPNETQPVTLKWPAGTLPVTDGQDGGKMEISPVSKASESPAG